MTTATDFLSGCHIAYTDMAGREIMAVCKKSSIDGLDEEERYSIKLYDFNTLAFLKSYNMTKRGATNFFHTHCNGNEKNIVSALPRVGAVNSGNPTNERG